MSSTINVAIVGYGYAGKGFHAYLVSLTPGLKVYAVVARSKELRDQAVADYGCKVFSNIDELLLDDQVQLVVIATPTSLHCEYAVKSMNAKKHVVTDKPMCSNLDECKVMIQAAKDNKVMLSVFQNRRWDGDFLTTKHVLDNNLLGQPVTYMELAFQKWGLSSKAWKSTSIEEGAGTFLDLGAHVVDQLNILFPKPIDTVYGRIHKDFANAPGVDSHSIVVVAYKDGSTAVLDTSASAAIPKPRFYLSGPLGNFSKFGLDPQENALVKGDIDSALDEESSYGVLSDGKSKTIIPTIKGRWRSYYENVAAHLLHGEPLVVTATQVYKNVAVLSAALESSKLNQVVKFDNFYTEPTL